MKLNRLLHYMRMTEAQLFKVAHKELSALDYAVYTNNKEEYIYAIPREGAENTIPVLLVAHMDTVHRYPPKIIYHDKEHNVLWTPEGLGADDRAGVFAVLELAKRYNVSVLLTTGEESGGIGAKAFTMDYPTNKDNLKMAIQFDRRGSNDCVFYSNEAEDFHEYIAAFGFVKATGSFSDISVIGPAWCINSVNLSIGYRSEHTSSEHLFIDEMITTINKAVEILTSPIPEFEYKERVRSVTKLYGSRGKWYDNYYYKGGTLTYDELTDRDGVEFCSWCGKAKPWTEMQLVGDDLYEVCDECFDDEGYFCAFCDAPCMEWLLEDPRAAALGVCDWCYATEKASHKQSKNIDKGKIIKYDRGEKGNAK